MSAVIRPSTRRPHSRDGCIGIVVSEDYADLRLTPGGKPLDML